MGILTSIEDFQEVDQVEVTVSVIAMIITRLSDASKSTKGAHQGEWFILKGGSG